MRNDKTNKCLNEHIYNSWFQNKFMGILSVTEALIAYLMSNIRIYTSFCFDAINFYWNFAKTSFDIAQKIEVFN